MEIAPFDAVTATEDELRHHHRFRVASFAIDRPGRPVPTFEQFVGQLRNPEPGLGDPVCWAARRGGRPVGLCSLFVPETENTHLGLILLVVDPEHRDRGVGSRLLSTATEELRRRGRSVIEAWGIVQDGIGEKWAQRRAFRTVHGRQVQELVIDGVDPARWMLDPPEGYRLTRWSNRCPESLVTSYARARTAIHDAPMGGSGAHAPEWTVERVRAGEQEHVDRHIDAEVVAAIHEPTGEVAGLTELQFRPHRDDLAYQMDTAVVAHHRGHRLGRCMKAAMMRWVIAHKPGLQKIVTHTGTENTHMIAVNRALGYTDVVVNVVCNGAVDAVAQATREFL